jgi:hypothetical protein
MENITAMIRVQIFPGRLSKAVTKLRRFFGQSIPEPVDAWYRAACTLEWDLITGDAVSNTAQCIQVGTGMAPPLDALRLRCASPISTRSLDTEPEFDWDWGRMEDMETDTITYWATFPPGSVLNKRITEICVCNGDVNLGGVRNGDAGIGDVWNDDEFPASCMVYGQLDEALPVKAGDTLRVTALLTCVRPRAEEEKEGK